MNILGQKRPLFENRKFHYYIYIVILEYAHKNYLVRQTQKLTFLFRKHLPINHQRVYGKGKPTPTLYSHHGARVCFLLAVSISKIQQTWNWTGTFAFILPHNRLVLICAHAQNLLRWNFSKITLHWNANYSAPKAVTLVIRLVNEIY